MILGSQPQVRHLYLFCANDVSAYPMLPSVTNHDNTHLHYLSYTAAGKQSAAAAGNCAWAEAKLGSHPSQRTGIPLHIIKQCEGKSLVDLLRSAKRSWQESPYTLQRSIDCLPARKNDQTQKRIEKVGRKIHSCR